MLVAVLLSISNYPYIANGGMHYTVYSIFTFNAKDYSVNECIYNVEKYVYSHGDEFFYIGFPLYMERDNYISSLFDNIKFIPTLNASYLASQGVKYVITTEPIDEKGLVLVYTSGNYKVYEDEEFVSTAFSNDGYLNISVSPCKIIVKGNSSMAYVEYPFDRFWNTSGGNSSIMIIPMHNGEGIAVNSEPIVNDYLMAANLVSFIIIIVGIVFTRFKIRKILFQAKGYR
ncbi:hypothetical protein HS5_24090 [Acidianus sp. HS-5]|nr:hypothetical protein HS5_24090 [Acidianus sp. HS-5]